MTSQIWPRTARQKSSSSQVSHSDYFTVRTYVYCDDQYFHPFPRVPSLALQCCSFLAFGGGGGDNRWRRPRRWTPRRPPPTPFARLSRRASSRYTNYLVGCLLARVFLGPNRWWEPSHSASAPRRTDWLLLTYYWMPERERYIQTNWRSSPWHDFFLFFFLEEKKKSVRANVHDGIWDSLSSAEGGSYVQPLCVEMANTAENEGVNHSLSLRMIDLHLSSWP